MQGIGVDPESGRPPVQTNFRPLIRTGAGGRIGVLVQVASLLLTGITFWVGRLGHVLPVVPLGAVVAGAFFFAFLACVWSAVITFGLYLAAPRAREGMIDGILRTASVAVWFAPATILFSRWSPMTLTAAVVLVVTATRLIYSEWQSGEPRAAAEFGGTLPIGILGPQAVWRPLFTRDFVTGLVAAAFLHFAATSAMFRHRAVAGALFALSAAILTLFAMTTEAVDAERPRSLPQSLVGILLTIFLAAGVTVTGLRPRLFGGGDGVGEGTPNGEGSAARIERPPDPSMAAPPMLPDGSFPGVILWPEIQPVTRLVTPLAPQAGDGPAAARTYSIPFSGEYWLFRWPFHRPPARSYLQRGTPVALSFSTVDHWPLMMEAHQKLDPVVDLDCCRTVRVEIRNADRFPGTLFLELFALEGDAAHSMGVAPVVSTPDLGADPVAPVAETLEYRIVPGVRACTELKVVFRRTNQRLDRSARVAIDRFVLAR